MKLHQKISFIIFIFIAIFLKVVSNREKNSREFNIPLKRAKTSQARMIFSKFMIFLFGFFQKLFPKLNFSKQKTFSFVFSDILNSSKFVKFTKVLNLTQRAIKTLRNRTKFRTLKNVNEKFFEIIDDESYFMIKTLKRSFTMIRSKVFRGFISKLRRFFRRNFKISSAICSNFFFNLL